MKPIHLLLGVLLASSTLQAQTLDQTTANPPPVNYAIGEQGANSRVWQKIIQTADAQGNVTYQTNQAYVELATGLNHLVGGQWVASKEGINISPDGSSAAATNGQHQAYFPGNIYNGMIKLVTPDGEHLQSQPIGLSYFDGTNSVLLAVLTNSTGQILPSGNQVIYTNAFTEFAADLLYTYTKAGFEQDIILRQQPPDPVSLGLNPKTTRLQVLTEFFNPLQPSVTAATVPTDAGNLEDDSLSFGAMQMGRGKAFLLGTNSPSVGVDKQWMVLEGKQFLIEEVPIVSIAIAIDTLPPFARTGSGTTKHIVSKNLILPPQRLARTPSKTKFLAQAIPPSRGLVLDYQILNANTNAFTFQGDTTYYLSGAVSLSGTNTFEGGAVLKYATNASLDCSSATVNCLATAYRPVIFTAVDDNSVGETITNSTGNPTNYYANPAIAYNPSSGSLTLHNFRIVYAQQAISVPGGLSVTVYLTDGQIVDCANGVAAEYQVTGYLMNLLFANFQTALNLIGANVRAKNVTFDGNATNSVLFSENGSTVFNLTNCILSNIPNYSGGSPANGANNGFYNSGSSSYYIYGHSTTFGTSPITTTNNPFQTVGAGNYYLANGCIFTNAGTAIDSALLADLQQKTTQPPLIISNITASSSGTNLIPQVLRNTGTPDLGYHYDPLDYLVTQFTASTSGNPILLTNGVAVGLFGSYGFVLTGQGKLTSTGMPNLMNRLVWYPAVQEQPVLLMGLSPTNDGIFNVSGATNTGTGAPRPVIQLKFTDLPMLGTRQGFFYGPAYTLNLNTLSLKDCWLRGVNLTITSNTASYLNTTTAVTLQDDLFERSTVSLFNGHNVADNPLALTAYNDLFWNATVSLTYLDSSASSHPAWTNSDNLFDTATNTLTGNGSYTNYITMANDGFYNITNLLGGTNILTVTNLVYATGTLGSWYIGSSSPTVLYAGTRSAANAGLYHYTIQTNQVPEGTNTVSIGFHYVATDASGNPLDSNGDGIPDYLEDANGNGVYDTGDSGDWQNFNLKVLITRPRNGSLLP